MACPRRKRSRRNSEISGAQGRLLFTLGTARTTYVRGRVRIHLPSRTYARRLECIMNDHDCRTLINHLDRLSGIFAEMDDELVKAIAKKNRVTRRT